MENTILLGVIVIMLLLGLLIYVVYTNRKIKQSQEDIESFLASLSRSFHCAEWTHLTLHDKGERSNEEVAQSINEKIKTEIDHEFMTLFLRLYVFPSMRFSFSIGDPTTKEFIDKIHPTLGILYKKHVQKKASLDQLSKEFFTTTKQIILSQLEKEPST